MKLKLIDRDRELIPEGIVLDCERDWINMYTANLAKGESYETSKLGFRKEGC